VSEEIEMLRFIKQAHRDFRCWLFKHRHDAEPWPLGWHCSRCDRLGFDFSPFYDRPPLNRIGRRRLR
jgi:hypothetical protein